jgi:hypothetical protein
MKCEEKRWGEGLLCDECLSPDIRKLREDEADVMDCYCNNCKEPQYVVSQWWVNQPFNKIDWSKLAK